MAGEATKILNYLSARVVLIRLTISWPKLSRHMGEITVEVNGIEIPEELRNNPQWRIVPAEWQQRFRKVENAARKCLERLSLSLAVRGQVILPILSDLNIVSVLRLEELLSKLDEYNKEIVEIGNQFADEYDSTLNRVRETIGEDLFNGLRQRLPSADQVRKISRVRYGLLPLGNMLAPEDVNLTLQQVTQLVDALSDNPDLYNKAKELSNNLQTLLAESSACIYDRTIADYVANTTKTQLNQLALNLADAVFEEPRKAFAEALAHLSDALKQSKQIRQATLDNVISACRTLRDFSFIANNELLEQLNSIEQSIINTEPKQLNADKNLGVQLTQILDSAIRSVSDNLNADKQTFRSIALRIDENPSSV